jgi:hypothetical protein
MVIITVSIIPETYSGLYINMKFFVYFLNLIEKLSEMKNKLVLFDEWLIVEV